MQMNKVVVLKAASKMSLKAWILVLTQETCNPSSSDSSFSTSRAPKRISKDIFSLHTFSPHTFSPLNVPLARFYIPGPSPWGAVCPKLTPLGHGDHHDPCALKKGGRWSSRKNVAEEKWGRASELVKECCWGKMRAGFRAHERNVCERVCRKKKASHKRGDLSFTLLNTSHLRSH